MKVIQVALTDGNKVRVRFEGGEEVLSESALLGLPAALKVLALSDVPRDGDGRTQFSALALGESDLVSADVFRAFQAQLSLDAAEKAGKILPAQRAFYERMALSDLPAFEGLVASMKPQVEMKEHGTAGEGGATGLSDLDKVDAQLHEKATAIANKLSIGFGQALKVAMSENPSLAQERARLVKEVG